MELDQVEFSGASETYSPKKSLSGMLHLFSAQRKQAKGSKQKAASARTVS
jgi:hypothetical protein